jgi:hypothetical protein
MDAAFLSFWHAAARLVTAGTACLAVACDVPGVPGHCVWLAPPARRPAWLGGYGVDAAFMLLLLHEGGIHAF